MIQREKDSISNIFISYKKELEDLKITLKNNLTKDVEAYRIATEKTMDDIQNNYKNSIQNTIFTTLAEMNTKNDDFEEFFSKQKARLESLNSQMNDSLSKFKQLQNINNPVQQSTNNSEPRNPIIIPKQSINNYVQQNTNNSEPRNPIPINPKNSEPREQEKLQKVYPRQDTNKNTLLDTDDLSATNQNEEDTGMSKMMIIGGCVAAATGIGLLLYMKNKTKKVHNTSTTTPQENFRSISRKKTKPKSKKREKKRF